MRPEKQTLEDARSGGRTLLTLVIPTRNEVDNVPRLVRELRESLTGVDYRVVFVDDSTDRTPQVIRSTSEEDGRIFLIHREEAEQGGGLSTAVIRRRHSQLNRTVYRRRPPLANRLRQRF